VYVERVRKTEREGREREREREREHSYHFFCLLRDFYENLGEVLSCMPVKSQFSMKLPFFF
jgi:hypothetical protein